MKRSKLIELYEQLERSLGRAETSKKDLDLLVCLRVLFYLIEERIKEYDN